MGPLVQLDADTFIAWDTRTDAPAGHTLTKVEATAAHGTGAVENATEPGFNRAGPNGEQLTAAGIAARYQPGANPDTDPLDPDHVTWAWWTFTQLIDPTASTIDLGAATGSNRDGWEYANPVEWDPEWVCAIRARTIGGTFEASSFVLHPRLAVWARMAYASGEATLWLPTSLLDRARSELAQPIPVGAADPKPGEKPKPDRRQLADGTVLLPVTRVALRAAVDAALTAVSPA